MPAKPENVAAVRHVLAGLAEEVGMDDAGLADLKTVVTEACMNVVVHAYEGEPGPLEVEASADPDGVSVIVRDEGSGMRPRASDDRESLRLGLSLIATLSGSFSIAGGLGRGTEVSMRIPLSGGGADGGADPTRMKPADAGRAEVVIDRPEMLGPVLSRMVGTLAARRQLPVDRVSEAVLVTDAISEAAPSRFLDGRVRLGLEERPRGLAMRLGPMEPGGAEAVREEMELPDVGGSLETLADELSVESGGDGDYLLISFADP